ncbi:MAG: LLM class F420-dependent oxidoreductase [Chloroflexota bacterium]|nr:TIGR03617 family F420-dependent LLM class oxidoreductase [Chloroflexota bacterium]NOG65691.1 TIGR03617 family F420-dependent LLM class oxidoreductase [Chloroflexota bacterium]GIK63831.1 MAG: LLM class F420-dependent oxidoreductase [Chloroflexota bacterium]
MKFDVTIMPDDLNTVPETAKELEGMGFDGIWTSETMYNPFFPLSLAAYTTQKIELGTAIAVAFPRSPMIMAHTAWDLAAQSKGRFILGLGTQVKPHITKRFSTVWDSPGPRLRDYILAMRAIWDCWQHNTPLNYRGEFYQHTLMTPFFQPRAIEHADIPIYIAGVNTYLCQLAGELCQGFHVHPFHTADYLRDMVIPNVEIGAQKTGRSRSDIALTCAIFVVTGKDTEEIENQKAMVKSQIAFYASTPTYRTVMDHHGWGDLHEELNTMSRTGRWMEMHEKISDAMLEKCAVIGTYDELPHKVKERYTGLLDRIAYYFPYVSGERQEMWQKSLEGFNV